MGGLAGGGLWIALCLAQLFTPPAKLAAQPHRQAEDAPPGEQAGAVWGRAEGPPVSHPGSLPRWTLVTTLGRSLRLRRDRALGQKRLGPTYLDGLVSYGFGSPGRWQHGPALQWSLGLQDDGGFYEPVSGLSQVLLAPGYALAYNLGPDWVALGHGVLPIGFGEERQFGVELGGTFGYRLLAGVAVVAQVGVALFAGVDSSVHPLVSAEFGVLVDYEVLP